MARIEAELAGANEAVMLNTDGFVAEAASSNLFWVDQGKVFTPPLSSGPLAGVTRGFVLRLCDELGIARHESTLAPFDLTKKEGLFLTMSSMEVVEVCSVNGHPVKVSPLTRQLRAAYRASVKRVP
jgi:branched-chain amino acid aminotransferase